MKPITWCREGPMFPGTYLVRPILAAFLEGTGINVEKPPIRVVTVEAGDTRFDAGDFAGPIAYECWEWSGPIEIPDHP